MNKRIACSIIIVMVLILLVSSLSFAANETNEALKNFQGTINRYANILIAFSLSTSILIFIIHFIRLANSYDHPFMRRQVQRDIFISGVTVAMIGGIGIIGKIIAATALSMP